MAHREAPIVCGFFGRLGRCCISPLFNGLNVRQRPAHWSSCGGRQGGLLPIATNHGADNARSTIEVERHHGPQSSALGATLPGASPYCAFGFVITGGSLTCRLPKCHRSRVAWARRVRSVRPLYAEGRVPAVHWFVSGRRILRRGILRSKDRSTRDVVQNSRSDQCDHSTGVVARVVCLPSRGVLSGRR